MPMKRILVLFMSCAMTWSAASAQVRFRSGIFLHHSTGGCIWGPNGSATSVPQEMQSYNLNHGYSGLDSVSLQQQWYPSAAGDNEWSTWHGIFETNLPDDIAGILSANRIVMIKSCFPASDMSGAGQPSDTLSPAEKTIYNYKWHWRHIVSVMNGHRGDYFVIWTNAPLEVNSTDSNAARLSDVFCRWAKDTLEAGLDPVFGAFPPNVHVFDFFHKLSNSDGFLPDMYRSGPGDSHPNAAATVLVAPLLVTELFDAAIAYEPVYNGVGGAPGAPGPGDGPTLARISPNPAGSSAAVRYHLPAAGRVSVRIYNGAGQLVRTLVDRDQAAGDHRAWWDGRDAAGRPAAGGAYFCRLGSGQGPRTQRMVLVR
jgi:hypothetical protein